MKKFRKFFNNKNILVTGGTGSFGKKFVEFISELPDDFSNCLKKWRSFSKNSMAS